MIKKYFLYGFITMLFSGSIWSQQTVGLFLNTPESFNGLSLFPTPSDQVFLIDNCGKVVNQWNVSAIGYGTALLLPDGDLLKSIRVPMNSFPAGGGAGKLERYSWDGALEWQMEYHDSLKIFHHDMTVLPNGNILFIAWERKTIAECEQAGRENIPPSGLWSETIVEIKPIGSDDYEIVWKWDIWDHLIQDFDPSLPNYGVIADHPERLNINLNDQGVASADWLHFNAVNYNETLDQIIVSSRGLNEVLIIDHSTSIEEAMSTSGGNADKGGDLLFRWGNPINYDQGEASDQQLYGQHNVQWIPSGYPGGDNILVFNNGAGIPENDIYSAVVELSPSVNNFNYELSNNTFLPEAPTWQYKDSPPSMFYSSRISSTQRLPNGNTLINEGQEGRFFEVDMDGNKLWEYVNPMNDFGPTIQSMQPDNNGVFTMRKYALSFEGFEGKDLTPGEPIELNPINTQCMTSGTQETSNSDVQIINPANNILNINFNSQKEHLVFLYDSIGKLVHSSTQTGSTAIDISHLKTALYFLRIDKKTTKVLITN